MDLLFVGLLALAAFIVFLMATSKRRKHYLEDAMRKLNTRRLTLMKEMERVKLLQDSGDLTQREAFTQLSHLEVELAEVQTRIIELKEKPLARTLEKQEKKEKAGKAVVEEGVEAERAEVALMSGLDAKLIVAGFAAVILLIVFVLATGGDEFSVFRPTPEAPKITMAAVAGQEGGVYAGSSGIIRAEIKNEGEESIKNLVLGAFVPDGSGLLFLGGKPYFYFRIAELEGQGARDIPIHINVGKEAVDGEYVVQLQLTDPDKLINKNTTAKLTVSFGSELEAAGRGN